jgi:hypothetical protein
MTNQMQDIPTWQTRRAHAAIAQILFELYPELGTDVASILAYQTAITATQSSENLDKWAGR